MRFSYEFKIGLVVALFLFVFVTTMGVLGYWRLSRPRGVLVKVYFERTTSGVTTGTNVYLGGAPVGFVRENRFDPEKNRPYLLLEIMRTMPVAKDSQFTIEQESFFGEPRVYVTQGDVRKGTLTSGGVADNLGTTKPTFTDLVADLDFQVRDVSQSVQAALSSAQSLLMQAQRTLLEIEPQIKASISQIPALMDQLRVNLNKVTEQVNKTLTVIQGAGNDTRQTIQDLRKQLNTVFERLDQSLAQVEMSLKEVTEMVASAENQKSLEETLANIREASENIRKLSETLAEEEVRTAVRETVQNVREVSEVASRGARSVQGIEVEATARAYYLEPHPLTDKVELGEQVQAMLSQESGNWFVGVGQERVGDHGNGMWYFGYKDGPTFRIGVGARRGAPSAKLRWQKGAAFIEASGWWKGQSPRGRYQIIGGVKTGRLEVFGGLEREDSEDPLGLVGFGFVF